MSELMISIPKISLENQAKYPSIPWSQIIGMRNRLIHGYDSVDLDVLLDEIITRSTLVCGGSNGTFF